MNLDLCTTQLACPSSWTFSFLWFDSILDNGSFGKGILIWMRGHYFHGRFFILVHVSSQLIIAGNNPRVFGIFHSNLLLAWQPL